MARNSIIGWIVKKLKGNMALVEDTETASQNISANKYVVFQGVLCTADAAISQGDTLATSGAGKNLTEVTGGGFNELNDHIATIQSSLPRYKGKGSYSSATYWGAVGFITGSGKNLYIQIPMIIAPDVTSITITECKIGLRTPSGGYLVSSDFNITSYITAKYAAREQGLIEIETEKSDQWGVANNSIVCGTVTMTFTLA